MPIAKVDMHLTTPLFLAQAADPINAASESAVAAWQKILPNASVGMLAGYVLALFAVSIVAHWISSFVFARDRAALASALLVWILSTIALFVLGVGLTILLPNIANAERSVFLGGLIAFAAIALAILIAIPMKVYEIAAPGAIGFWLLSLFIAGVGGAGLQIAMFGSVAALNQGQIRATVLEHMPKEIQEVAKLQATPEQRQQLAQRKAELESRFQQLEIQHRHLPPNDPAAVEAYLRAKSDYDRDLAQLKADVAALPLQ